MSSILNGYFGGGTSFMTNGYAIWQKGLAGDDKIRRPNYYAVHQGNTYVQRMLYDRSLDVRSSFSKLISYLQTIQNKEANKERAFVEHSLASSPLININSKQASAIRTAIDQDNFGMAYTLLLKTEEEYNKLVAEFHNGKFKNISHAKSFWDSQFSKYFSERLEQALEIQDDQLVKKVSQGSLTIDQIVEDYIDEKIGGAKGLAAGSLEDIKKRIKNDLARELFKHEIIPSNSIYNDLFQTPNQFTSISSKTSLETDAGKKRKFQTVVNKIGEELCKSVGMGMATEIEAAAKQGRVSDLTISTGDLMKNFTKALTGTEQEVKQKADTISFVLWQGNLDIQGLAREYFGEAMRPTEQSLQAFIDRIEETAGLGNKIFMISTNVKGYRSKFDLSIAQQATYKQRAADLVKLQDQAKGLPSLSIEKLIFLFNNTMKGCIAASETEKIAEYVAAICAAWMWDEYGEIFSVQEQDGVLQKIRMFDSGGTYYSASQLIQKSIEQLLKQTDGNFVSVVFKPAQFNAQGVYDELRSRHPVPSRDSSYEEWQGTLKLRWDEMREMVSRQSKMSISIKQKELEDILGDLSQYL